MIPRDISIVRDDLTHVSLSVAQSGGDWFLRALGEYEDGEVSHRLMCWLEPEEKELNQGRFAHYVADADFPDGLDVEHARSRQTYRSDVFARVFEWIGENIPRPWTIKAKVNGDIFVSFEDQKDSIHLGIVLSTICEDLET